MKPHEEKLINRELEGPEREEHILKARELKRGRLTRREVGELPLIASGALSPNGNSSPEKVSESTEESPLR